VPSDQRSRNVASTDVLRNVSFTTVRSSIQGEIAMAGSRTPDRPKLNPICPGAPDGSGAGAGGGATWS
jgi:hypothetical protein